MISAVIPTYRNPVCLDLCLKSATENRELGDTEIIVVIDGFPEESMPIVEKYNDISVVPLSQNMGMQYALNVGVMHARNKWVFIENDDNVFCPKWDSRFCEAIEYFQTPFAHNMCITINQVEAAASIFDFVIRDFGRNAQAFDYQKWLEWEPTIANRSDTPNGRLFPFLLTKKWYMAVGGFDTFYKSPFWCDVDFFTKLEMTEQIDFARWHGCHLYHFGSIATKNRVDVEAEMFCRTELPAAQAFAYKWGWLPNIVENARTRNNTKLPDTDVVRGITIQKE
jgi:glycosyltransferase involved in cell wall biosynthesis